MSADDDGAVASGSDRLKCPDLNKVTAFTASERDKYRLRGLLPARIYTPTAGQAFQSVGYPILPHVEQREMAGALPGYSLREVHHICHYSLFAPRDFVISPYFRILKPTLEAGFDHRLLTWADQLDSSNTRGIPP